MEHYDIISIGSSPKIFMKIVEYAKENKKILIIDSNDQLGGNWKTIDFSGCSNVEFGCFIMPYAKDNYNYLQNNMGIDLIEQKYQPYTLYKNKAYPITSILLPSKMAYDKKKNFRTLLRLFISHIYNISYKHKGQYTTKYFKYGIRTLLSSYEYFIRKFDIQVNYNETVTEIHIDHKIKKVLIKTDNKQLTSDKVLIGVGIEIDKITSDKSNFYINSCKLNIFTFAIFKIKISNELKFSYINFTYHDDNIISNDDLPKIDFYQGTQNEYPEYRLIWRINNITDYATNLEDGYALIAVDTNSWLPKNEHKKAMEKTIINFIKNTKILNHDIVVKEVEWFKKDSHSIGSLEATISKYFTPYIESTNSVFLTSQPS